MKYSITTDVVNNSLVDFDKLHFDLNVTISHNGNELMIELKDDNFWGPNFYSKETGERYYECGYDKVFQITNTFEVESPIGIEMNWIPNEEVLTRKLGEGLTGHYLVMMYDTRNRKIEFDIMRSYPNFCEVGGCFDFDIRHCKYMLGYVKLKD